MKLKEQIEKYIPFNEQEEVDKEYFLKYINTFEDVLTRNNWFGHFSGSAFVVNKDKTKVLMVYHNIFGSWIWPGRTCRWYRRFNSSSNKRSGRRNWCKDY